MVLRVLVVVLLLFRGLRLLVLLMIVCCLCMFLLLLRVFFLVLLGLCVPSCYGLVGFFVCVCVSPLFVLSSSCFSYALFVSYYYVFVIISLCFVLCLVCLRVVSSLCSCFSSVSVSSLSYYFYFVCCVSFSLSCCSFVVVGVRLIICRLLMRFLRIRLFCMFLCLRFVFF